MDNLSILSDVKVENPQEIMTVISYKPTHA